MTTSNIMERNDILRVEALRLAVHGVSETTLINFEPVANRYYLWLLNEETKKSARKISGKQVLK
jgi:hypothetical protein